MDLHHSGHSELLKVQTDKVALLIKGPSTHPKLEGREKSAQISQIKVRCTDTVDVMVWDGQSPDRISPLFFEQQNYEVIIQHDGVSNVEFWHVNRTVRESVTPIFDVNNMPGTLLTGMINFRGNIGLSELVVKLDGYDYLTIVIEVYPVKLDYKEDYLALIDDLTKEMYSMIFEFLRETYTGFEIGAERSNSLVEFWEIIKHIYKDYIRAAEMITKQPHHILERQYNVLPAYKAKKVDNKSVRWLSSHPQYVCRGEKGYLIEKVLDAKKVVTYDTKENRFTKFILQLTVKRLSEFKNKYLSMDRVKIYGPDDTVMAELNHMIIEINRKINSTFLKDVSAFNGQTQLSLVFTMAPGYRELFKYHMIMQHGLSLAGDIYHMSIKNLAEIYEYWCFVKLNSLLKTQYGLTSKDKAIIHVSKNGLFVTMAKKKSESRIEYKTDKGESIILSYNQGAMYPTGPQKPDNVLSIEKQDSKTRYQYVFDAKYRVNPAIPGSYYQRYIDDMPGPEEDDINTMHRYRDALVSNHRASTPYERIMFGAYVLFPLSKASNNVERYREHTFYKSIELVNIGGLPFLPSSTEYVEELLGKLINENPEEAYDRAILPEGTKQIIETYRAYQRLNEAQRKEIAYMIHSSNPEFDMVFQGLNDHDE